MQKTEETMNRQSGGWWASAHLLITLTLVSGLAHATDSLVLVSDVDDTVKITNVLDRDDLLKGAISESLFAGMPELYRHLLGTNSCAERLKFMSGSPSILNHKVAELLNEGHFPAHELTLRSVTEFFFSSVRAYKTKHMAELYGASSSTFILIGDDTESDPEVYAAFADARPAAVLAIYIHRITGRASLRRGALPFVTAYDVAMREFLAHRLSEQQAADVGRVVLDSKDRAFLPPFQSCPGEHEDIPALPDSLVSLKARIDARLNAVCESNRKQ
jgi:hypothetical protein